MMKKTDMNKNHVNSRMIKELKSLISKLSMEAEAGNKKAYMEKAWAIAICKFLESGHLLTDLPWFKHTKFYTGADKLDKAA